MLRNELLAAVVRADVATVRAWVERMPTVQRLKLGVRLSGGLAWSLVGMTLPEGAGPERLALMMQRMELDVNADGVVTDDEFAQNEKAQLRIVDTCGSQLLNMGVIAGLTLTVFYPLAVSPLVPSSHSAAYFGSRALDVFTYVYYVFMYYCVVQSVVLIMHSTRAYLQLTLWMPSLEAKIWYVDRMRMSDYVAACFNIIKSVVWSVPMGVAVTVSPFAGVLALCAFVYFYICLIKLSRTDVDALWVLRQYADAKLVRRDALSAATASHV
jgi:hypothetical protein